MVCLLVTHFIPSVVFAQRLENSGSRSIKEFVPGATFYYYFDAGNFEQGYYFEKVLSDTLIQGRTYHKIYLDPWKINTPQNTRVKRETDTFRFERATKSELYEWIPALGREILRLRTDPPYNDNDTTRLKNFAFDCTVGCLVGLGARTLARDENRLPFAWSILLQTGGNIFTVRYRSIVGFLEATNNLDNRFRREASLAGYAVKDTIYHYNGTINLIQQLDTLLQTSRITVGVREQEAATSLTLAPNPVGDEANVTFSLASSKRVRLVVVDNLGRVLLSVADAQLPAGEHRFPVRTESLANGVYWLRLWADAGVQTVPLVVRR